VKRKEYTVGFKVVLLLIITAAWAVSIEFPSLGLSHPNYPTLRPLRNYSPVPLSAAAAAYAAVFRDSGTAYAEKGDQDHAIADFNEAIRLNPEDAAAFSGRGAAYEAKGDLVRAAADRDTALHLEQRIPNPFPHEDRPESKALSDAVHPRK
jgi:tetratricopeptide (TPR) repeat protein